MKIEQKNIKIDNFYIKKLINYNNFNFIFLKFNKFKTNSINLIQQILNNKIINQFYSSEKLRVYVPTIYYKQKYKIIRKIMYSNLLLLCFKKELNDKKIEYQILKTNLKLFGITLEKHISKKNIIDIFNSSLNKNKMIEKYKHNTFIENSKKQKIKLFNQKNNIKINNLVLIRYGPFSNLEGYIKEIKENNIIIVSLRLFRNKFITVKIFKNEL